MRDLEKNNRNTPMRVPFGPLSCTYTLLACLCAHMSMRVRARLHTYACTGMRMCVYAHACACVCTHVCMHARTHAYEGRHLLTLLLLPKEPPCCRCLRSIRLLTFWLGLNNASNKLFSPSGTFLATSCSCSQTWLMFFNASFARPLYFDDSMCSRHTANG